MIAKSPSGSNFLIPLLMDLNLLFFTCVLILSPSTRRIPQLLLKMKWWMLCIFCPQGIPECSGYLLLHNNCPKTSWFKTIILLIPLWFEQVSAETDSLCSMWHQLGVITWGWRAYFKGGSLPCDWQINAGCIQGFTLSPPGSLCRQLGHSHNVVDSKSEHPKKTAWELCGLL